jgi:hypothetical protein
LNPLASGYRSTEALNADIEAIEEAFNNTLSRDGTSPNSMGAALDMDGHAILNLPAPTDPNDVVRLQDLEEYLDPIPYVEDLVAAAEEAAESAAEALEDIEALATQTAADAVQTGEDRADVEAMRDETAIYSGATNVSGIFVDTTAGLAATANQGYFYVPSTDGLALYRDNAGSAVAGPVMPSVDYLGKRHQVIWCVATYTGGGTTNAQRWDPIDTTVRFLGDGTKYILMALSPVANNLGSGAIDVTVRDGAGNTFLTAAIRKGTANASMAANDIAAGDLMMIKRSLTTGIGADASQRWKWLLASDVATKNSAAMNVHTDLLTTSSIRPLMYVKADTNLHLIDMRLDESKYDASVSRRRSDRVKIAEMDLSDFMSDTGYNAVSLNSYFGRLEGRILEHLNMVFRDLIGGVVTDTGRSPTALEPPMDGGKFGDASVLQVVAGMSHGHVVEPATSYTMTYADPSTSEVDTNVSISVTAPIGTRYYGDKIVKTLTFKAENAAHDIWCFVTYVVTYDPADTDQIRIQSTFDFTHASVTVTPSMKRGFGMLAAFTDIDMAEAIVNGVAQGPIYCDQRDSDDIPIGFPEQVYFWNSDFPEAQIVVTNNFGYGYTHKENGVLVANATPSYIDPFDDYIKLYGGLYGDHSGAPVMRNMTGIVVTTDQGIRFIKAPARA